MPIPPRAMSKWWIERHCMGGRECTVKKEEKNRVCFHWPGVSRSWLTMTQHPLAQRIFFFFFFFFLPIERHQKEKYKRVDDEWNRIVDMANGRFFTPNGSFVQIWHAPAEFRCDDRNLVVSLSALSLRRSIVNRQIQRHLNDQYIPLTLSSTERRISSKHWPSHP